MAHRHCGMVIVGILCLAISPALVEAQRITTASPYYSVKSQIIDFSFDRPNTEEYSQSTLFPQQPPATSAPAVSSGDLTLFANFGNNILDSFKGNNVYFHLAGIAATTLIVPTNIDYDVEHYFNNHPEYSTWAHPVVFTGQFLPFVAGGSLLAYGELKNDKETLGASFAVIQASVIELLYNSALKAVTGRPHPDWRHVSNMDSLSKTFRFGFLRGGAFWGWPSGHTSATMAVVSALTSYYPHNTWLKIAGFGLVAYTIFGVSAANRGGMHWFSDAIAGTLMSYAVGSTVGRYYRNAYSSRSSSDGNSTSYRLSPDMNPFGISISLQF